MRPRRRQVGKLGQRELSATSRPDIHALAIGIAATLARGTGSTGALSGAGSGAGAIVMSTAQLAVP